MTEFNPYLMLLRQFFAVAIGCRHNAQIFKLRGMETVGQGLNVLTNVRKTLTGLLDVIVKVNRRRVARLEEAFVTLDELLRSHIGKLKRRPRRR